MRQPTRPFTVEIKSSRKTKKSDAPSLWAGIDLADVSRKVSADLGTDYAVAMERPATADAPAEAG